jgi:hypothetical protein
MRSDGNGWYEFSRYDDKVAFPVYTSPPTRKTLSDDEIEKIFLDGCESDDFIDFARAIEKANGISNE